METTVEYQKDLVDYYTPEQIEMLRAMIQEGHADVERGEVYPIEDVYLDFGLKPKAAS